MPGPLTTSGRRQTKLLQLSSHRRVVHLESISSDLLERDHLASFLKNVSNHRHELERKLHDVKIIKLALVATVRFHAEEIRTVKAKKRSLPHFVVDQAASSGPSKERRRNGTTYRKQSVSTVWITRKEFKSVSTWGARNTAEFFFWTGEAAMNTPG